MIDTVLTEILRAGFQVWPHDQHETKFIAEASFAQT